MSRFRHLSVSITLSVAISWLCSSAVSASPFLPGDSGLWAGVIQATNSVLDRPYPVLFRLDTTAAVGSEFAELRFYSPDGLGDSEHIVLLAAEGGKLTGRRAAGRILEFQVDNSEIAFKTFEGAEHVISRTIRARTLQPPEGSATDHTIVLYRFEGATLDSPPTIQEIAVRENARLRAERSDTLRTREANELLGQITDGQWYSDPETGCQVLLSRVEVAGLHKFMRAEMASIRWDGECVDGRAEGVGVLQHLDGRGLTFWEDHMLGTNGVVMVSGIPTARPDHALVRYWLTECSKSIGSTLLYARVNISFLGSLDLAHPLVTKELARRAVEALGSSCAQQQPQGTHIRVTTRFAVQEGHPDNPSGNRDWETGVLFRGEIANGQVVNAELYDPWVRYPDASWLDAFADRVAVARTNLRSQEQALKVQQEAQAQRRLEESRTGAVIRTRYTLEQEYYDLAVMFEFFSLYGREPRPLIRIGATVPAQFPNAEFDARSAIDCAQGTWLRDTQKEWDDFNLFLEISGATITNRSLKLNDIEISCTEDLVFTIRTPSLLHTLALLDYSRHQPRSISSPTNYRLPEYFSLSLNPRGALRTNNPSVDAQIEGLCCVKGIRIFEDNLLRSFGAEVVGLDTGTGLQQVLFQGRETPQRLTPSGPNHIYVNLEGDSMWDHLTLDLETGDLTWRRTTTPPR